MGAAAGGRRRTVLRSLVEPDVLEPRPVVDAVLMQHEAFHLRVPARGGALEMDDRPRHVLGEAALDLPDELLALLDVRLLGLLGNEALSLLVAVLRVVALRAARVVLDEIDVGIVHREAGQIETYGIVPAREFAVPDRDVDEVKVGVELY